MKTWELAIYELNIQLICLAVNVSGWQLPKHLYSNPSIILADEPTASLDSDRAYEVMELLKNETKNKNTTTIVVTHDIRLVGYCDKVYKMTDGVLNLQDKNRTVK